MDSHLLFAGINFAIYISLLVFFLRRPLKEFWAQRAESLRTRIANARQRRGRAEAEYQNLSNRFQKLSQELKALKEQMRADGELEKQHIVDQAAKLAEHLAESSRRIVNQEATKARYRLQTLAVQLTTAQARRSLQTQLTTEDQERLITQSLDALATGELELFEGGLA